MARSVIMPKTGMAMEEGTILRWLKKPGDTVRRGEPIAVIETDKVTMDLEAEDEGTLLALVHEGGAVVKATDTIAWIGAPGEKVGPVAPAGAGKETTPAPRSAVAPVPVAPGPPPAAAGAVPGRLPATPAARRLAAESGVPLATLRGTGPGGAVRARDVAERAPRPPLAGTPVPGTGMRRAIAEKMLRSQGVPAVTLVTRADVTELASLRERVNASGGARVSFTDFLVRAAAQALKQNPLLNSVVEGDRVVQREEVNVGVAVAMETGLIVPVIQAADRLSVRQISQRLRDLADRARRGALTPGDCAGGTFTITNLGMYGITEFTPLINVPESAILGVGAVEEVLRRGPAGEIQSRSVMSLCLTHDHRHIDGAPAAVFLKTVRTLLEDCWALVA